VGTLTCLRRLRKSALLAAAQVDWPKLRDWIELGRPYSLVALDVLCYYSGAGVPDGWHAPDGDELQMVLEDAAETAPAPRVELSVDALLQEPGSLATKK